MNRLEVPRRLVAVAAAIAATLVIPALAAAHLERPSYWPNPGPDTSVTPAAGGEVPKIRSLGSAVTGAGPGKVRVVCQGRGGRASLAALRASLASARRDGYRLRPSQPIVRVSAAQSRRLLRINRALAKQCRYDSIQAAVTASKNNDRVVIMPGRYLEPRSRAAKLNDPACADLTVVDSSGAKTPSYAYQVKCPNDQNLVHVAGRALAGEPPSPARDDRHGIPDEGPCIRCNLQIEGSGVKPEDVLLDGGDGYDSDAPTAKPAAYAKHVVMRVDRGDGFVGRNFLLRGAREHGFYAEETDGVHLDRVKFFWARDYGHLSFTSDHHLVQNCEGFGAGDAVIYPGASPETGNQVDRDFYGGPRINTVITRCDMHGSALGYSGSMGNAVRITENHIYGNMTGIASDSLSAQGHPGYPADGSQIDHNLIYSNNLDLYNPASPPVEPLVPVPIGVGIIYAGMNDARVHDNWIFDNWRHGAMLLAIPDQIAGVEPEGRVNDGISCPNPPPRGLASTSCGNRFSSNHLGVAPPGFQPPTAIEMFGNRSGGSGGVLRNGNDFWWDEFIGNTGNCWTDNVGPDGTPDSVTGPGSGVPPDTLPSDCENSMGMGDLVKEAIIVDCGGVLPPLGLCFFEQMPARPGSSAARAQQRRSDDVARRFLRTSVADRLAERLGVVVPHAG